MLLKRNLLETVTLLSCSGTVVCILLNAVTNISPITGVWLLIYILGLFVVSVFLSIRLIQWLLHLNRPLKYELSWIDDYPFLGFLRDFLPRVSIKKKAGPDCAEYDTNELSVISTVLERKLVSSWYVPYVSEEIGFPFACKQLLDQMINKTFQICHKIETKDVFVDMCAIFITHLKEYKKAVKRHEKSPTTSVDSFYKKTHPIFNSTDKKITSADHCVNILRIILKELVPWELWDTPHSELLIRVLAKKLDHFIDNTLSDPAWLNDKLFTLLSNKNVDETIPTESQKENVGEDKVKVPETDKSNEIKKQLTPPPETRFSSSESAAEIKIVPSTPKVYKEEPKEILETKGTTEKVNNAEVMSSQPVEIKPTAVLRQRRGRQGRNEVKIYDRIIEGSVKTWETDMDLQCISVGQDLLASLDEMTLSRLWGQEDTEHSPNLRNRSPQPLWFGEEDSIDLEQQEAVEVKEAKKESSPKPADALLKDIQSTVHQAKSKIGDLQVPLDIDVPCKHSSDEAAGMMEGLLDIGLAGIKKGLRFTGLSDDPQEKSPSHHKDKNSGKVTPPEISRSGHSKAPANEHKESASHYAQKAEESNNSVPHLVKQQRVSSQDSVPSQPRGPREPPGAPLAESPEPEYEEVADLSTSIARLRSLLQDTGHRSQYMFCEGAEETAGRALPAAGHASSRPVDTATLADEYDMSGESSSPRHAPNNMQRLDRLFQRTVTGMLNSIKTAVSADDDVRPQPAAAWGYVLADGGDASVGGAVGRLLGARRSLWQVDAALDSLQQLPPPPRAAPPAPPEDWEEWCCGEGARWSGAWSAVSEAGLAHRHVPHRLATLLFAELGEALISSWLEELAARLRAEVFVVFRRMSAQQEAAARPAPLREFRPEETCKMLLDKLPGMFVFGEDAVTEAVGSVVGSVSHKAVNRDVIYRALDLLAVHFKKSAGLRNPSFDSN